MNSNFTTKGNFRLILVRAREADKRNGSSKVGKKRTSEKDTIYSFNKYLSGVYLGFKLVRSDAPEDR